VANVVAFATFAGQPHGALWIYAGGGAWTLTDLNTLIDTTHRLDH
jgi:hypothetical protein